MRLSLKHLLAAGLAALVIIPACKTHYKTSTHPFTVSKQDNSVERGKNLAFNICAGCHYNKETMKFTGKQFKDVPKIAGKVFAANLTQTKGGEMSHYTDAEFAYLMRTGIDHHGKFIPYMLRPNIADQDLRDLWVYLHSNDPAVAADDASPGETHLTWIGKLGVSLLVKPKPYKENIPRPDENNAVAYGAYLIDNIGCYHCHSKSSKSINYLEPEKTKGYMAGGAKFKTKEGKVYGANLTFDKETGIGNWSKEDFRKAVQQSVDEHGKKLKPPMHPFPKMTDKQADAIYVYLQTLPPKKHDVE